MRRAQRVDIPVIVALLRDHHAEHAFSFPFDPVVASIDLAAAIEDDQWLCLVADRSVLLAQCFRPSLVPIKIAAEVMLRCGRPGVRRQFVERFETWALMKGCAIARLATTHSVPAFGRLYQRDGYALAEATFTKVL